MPAYDIIEVPAGTTRTITLVDDVILEDTLIDITADGATVIIEAIADNWTIRNVGIKGQHPGNENVLKCCVTSPNATGTVENFYLGDGFVPGSKGGIYVHSQPAHQGELTFRNIHVAHSSNNGLYASGPGYKGQPGVTNVIGSYFYSNNISNVRLGTPHERSVVRDTTIHVDNSVNGCRMNCSSPGAVNARGIWAWEGPVLVKNCDIQTNGHGNAFVTRNGGSIIRQITRTGSNADTSPPESVPMSAEDAASGGASADPYDHELVIDGDGSETTYKLDVEGPRLDPSPADGATFNDVDDTIDGTTATGTVFGGVDAYRFDGELASFELDGSLERLELDGDQRNPADYRTGNNDGDDNDNDNDDSENGNDSGMTNDYTTITVPAGSTRTFSIGSGETLENTLIDITANGAEYRINTSGSNWTIRNVGVKGRFDSTAKVSPFIVRTDGGSGTVDNVYLGDGANMSGSATGIFVLRSHAGHIDIRNVNIQRWPDNGLYGSAPGNGSDHPAPGGGGTVAVEDSYSAHNGIANFRLGTTGSSVTNSVMEGGKHRSFWCYYEHPKLIDCDITGAHLVVGEKLYNKGKTAQVTAENCRYDVNVTRSTSGNRFHGSSQGAPDTTLPDGVPTSPEMAASGGGADTGRDGSSGGNGGDTGGTSEYDHTLVIHGSNSLAEYSFVIDGETVVPHQGGGATFDPEDEIAGTVASGTVHGGLDAYNFSGELVDLTVEGPATFELDGVEIDPADYGGTDGGGDGGGSDDGGSGDDGGGGGEVTTRRLALRTPRLDRKLRQTYVLVADGIEPIERTIEDHETFVRFDGKVLVRGEMMTGGFVDEFDVRGDVYVYDGDDRLSVYVDGEQTADPTTV